MIRIFIADDHPIVRQGLRELIARQPDMQVVGEAEDGHAVVNAQDRASWDVLLLDLSLPRLSGIEVVRRLRSERPGPRIVVLSMYPEDQYAHRLLEEGASAYLSKSLPPQEVIRALRAVAAGEVYTRPGRERSEAPSPGDAPHKSLSARENQVFMRLYQGRTVTEIAAELDLSVSTVSTHVTNIKSKLKARSIGEIINYAHRIGIVE
jgi:DNA-binding NarL/FixJ family response regulator